MQTFRYLISGRVQKVYFRQSAKAQALALGITGWVRNTENNQVEIIASGSSEALLEFEQWCAAGPALAQVTEVEKTALPYEPYHDFTVLRS